jgi:hypothetical protein
VGQQGFIFSRSWIPASLIFCSAWIPNFASAWIYPEHRDIAMLAAESLDPERAAVFNQLWADARFDNEQRLCVQGADTEQTVAPDCIDWAALSGISGDHACSSEQLLETVTDSDWILAVADIAAQLKLDLAEIPVVTPADQIEITSDLVADSQERYASQANRAKRVNALRTADTRLQRADVEYATRAGANNAHFLLARNSTQQTGDEYAAATLALGSELSAIGVYSWYHMSALQKASRLANEQLSTGQRRELARALLFDEAFALHFLEDVFASGHVAGTWGDASQRKGTHDFYNQNGLETFTWDSRGSSKVLMGDAHLRDEDAEVAGSAVQKSLAQVLDAASGQLEIPLPHRPAAPVKPDDFDVCQNMALPQRDEGMRGEGDYEVALTEMLAPTPVPALGPGLGAMPRFRSELGPFIGLAGAIDARGVSGGFDSSQNKDAGAIGGLELAIRGGLGLEGALGESSDGLVYASLGFRVDSPSTNSFSDADLGSLGGNLSAAIPARTGLTLRLRMPFYVLPADLLLLSPMYLFKPDTYTKMAVTATNGGLLRVQQGIATPLGRFQFVLGRELGVTFYGLEGDDQLVAPGAEPGSPARIVSFKSTSFELPIFEFRPYRAFSTNQSSSLMFQFYGGVDIPSDGSVDLPVGAPPVDLKTIWFLGIRLMFDWRYYM